MSAKKEATPVFELPDFVTFSIVRLPVDQNSPIASERIIQTVTKKGVTKAYVTESSYYKHEMYSFLAKFLELSYELSIAQRQMVLVPVAGGRYWLSFSKDTLDGKPQKRVNPENFE